MKYAATPRPQVLRALVGVECELQEFHAEGHTPAHVIAAQEEEARIAQEREDAEVRQWEIDRMWSLCSCGSEYCTLEYTDHTNSMWSDWDDFDYAAEQAEWEEIGRVWAAMHEARAIVRTQLVPLSVDLRA